MKRLFYTSMTIFFVYVLHVSSVMSADPYFPGGNGEGSLANPFRINTATELTVLSRLVHDEEGSYASACYILMNDVSLSGINDWKPIGRQYWDDAIKEQVKRPFKGTFDGNEKIITGFQISTEDNYQGLFGYVENCTVKNLTLQSVNIRSGWWSGGVIGYALTATIENCHVSGSITAYNENLSVNFLGGIAGKIDNTEGNGKKNIIRNCTNSALIAGYANIGGIAGAVQKSQPDYEENEISACYNFGNITSEAAAGGVSSEVQGYIFNCHNSGIITGKEMTGGISGRYYGEMKDCTNSGSIIDNTTYVIGDAFGAGGITGQSRLSKITNCHNQGTVSGIGYKYTGGIAGILAYDVTVTSCTNAGAVNGNEFVGGIAGRAGNGTSGGEGDCHIIDCYNTGNVTGKLVTGGVLGCLDIRSSIRNSYCTGFVRGEFLTGGIVGGIDNYFTISYCYSTGGVTGNGSDAGGIVGGTINNLSEDDGIRSTSGNDEEEGTIIGCYSTSEIEADSYAGGIAGRLGEGHAIENCAALNPSISAREHTGRISGGEAVFRNNFAYKSMSGVPSPSDSGDSKDGSGKSKDEIREASAWETVILGEEAGWSYTPGFLPVLPETGGAQSGDWPEYLLNNNEQKQLLTVNNGSGSGEYTIGAPVLVSAVSPEKGKIFKEWGIQGGTINQEDKFKESFLFIMPATNVTLTPIFENISDIMEIYDKKEILIYPNPFTEGFYVKGIRENAVLTAYNLNGQLLFQMSIKDNEYISSEALSKGMYVIKVVSDNTVIAEKVMKK